MAPKASEPSNKGDPAGSPPPRQASSHKSLSISVSLRDQAEKLLSEHTRNATQRGDPIRIIDKEGFVSLREQIVELLSQQTTHTITPIELSTLSAELSAARLQLNLFENQKAKLEFATKVAAEDAVKFKELLEVEAQLRMKSVADSLKQEDEAKTKLAALQVENGILKGQILKAKNTKNVELESELNAKKGVNSKMIMDLNNSLQSANSAKAESRREIKRYQDQLLALNNELNLVKAKLGPGEGKSLTFAEVAGKAGAAPVRIFNSLHKSLSDKSKAFLKKAKEGKDDDVKNKAFWLKAALGSSKSAILVPYKLFLEGIYPDIVRVEYTSRKAFAPIIDKLLNVLTGVGPEVSPDELAQILEDFDTKKIRMVKKLQDKGIYTLDDFIHTSQDIRTLRVSDIDSEFGAEAHSIDERIQNRNLKGKEREVAPSTSGTKDPETGLDPDLQEKLPRRSLYQWARDKVSSAFIWTANKSAEKPRVRTSTKIISWLKRKMGLAGYVLSLPVALCSFLSFGTW